MNLVGRYKAGKLINSGVADKFYKFCKCSEIDIVAENNALISIDGESVMQKNIHISVSPKALKFIIPKSSNYDG